MILVLLLACASGWFLAAALTPRIGTWPRWTSTLYLGGLAVLFGPGLASIPYFALVILNSLRMSDVQVPSGVAPGTVYALLGLMLAAPAALWWAFREPTPVRPKPSHKFPWTWLLAAAFGVACLLLALDIQAATQANPHGEWDASAIWNVRARYLAGGPLTWTRAISPSPGGGMTSSSHPAYPLFLSAFLAMQWTIGGFDITGPIVTGALISAAVLALLVAGLATRRSTTLGLLVGLLLLGTELFASQASSQYSDLLEGLAFLAALMLLDLAQEGSAAGSRRLLIAAGLAIGLAPWIKNEGQPFAIAALAVSFWRFRGEAFWTLLGAVPGIAATAALKLMSEGRETMFPSTLGGMAAKLADFSRWWQAFLGFGKAVVDAGPVWAHPVLLVVALAVVLRMIPPQERRTRLWLAVPIAVTLAAEYGLYLITTADLDWHISTSVSRLLAQVWPSLLWLLLSVLRTPEEYFEAPEPVAVPQGRGKRARA